MLVLNLHTAHVEHIPPKGEGHLSDSPGVRNLARAGLIKILDDKAPVPDPEPTAEAIASLTRENDALRHQLKLAREEIAALNKRITDDTKAKKAAGKPSAE